MPDFSQSLAPAPRSRGGSGILMGAAAGLGTLAALGLVAAVAWSMLLPQASAPVAINKVMEQREAKDDKLAACMKSESIQKEIKARNFPDPKMAAHLLCS